MIAFSSSEEKAWADIGRLKMEPTWKSFNNRITGIAILIAQLGQFPIVLQGLNLFFLKGLLLKGLGGPNGPGNGAGIKTGRISEAV